MRVDDAIYDMIKLAADDQKRNLSNFIEFATIQYLTSSQFVENDEMAETLEDRELVKNLMNGLEDFKKDDYTKLYSKIENFVYPQLRENPLYGSNIKKFKDNLEGYYRYRIGNYRLFYLIEGVAVVDFKHR